MGMHTIPIAMSMTIFLMYVFLRPGIPAADPVRTSYTPTCSRPVGAGLLRLQLKYTIQILVQPACGENINDTVSEFLFWRDVTGVE
jgi:hypothetical protein